MPYTLLRGEFVIRYPDLPRQGPEPDGDTIEFRPDTPALVETLPRRSGTPADIDARGISARLEAIDALETHFQETHQELAGANAARDDLLRRLGFTNVRFFDDLPNKVESADQDALRGHVLSNGIDANGRLIAFVYPGEHSGPDGTTVFVDPALVDQSLNAQLLAAGHAYPAFYATLPADLRTHLAVVSRAARAAQPPAGIWPRSTADPNGAATIANLDAAEGLVIWPKLFRRIVPYLASGFPDFDGFDAWLRADPVNRDDELFLLERLERGNMHDVVRGVGQQIQLTVWPEDFIISPDPPAGGGGTAIWSTRVGLAGEAVVSDQGDLYSSASPLEVAVSAAADVPEEAKAELVAKIVQRLAPTQQQEAAAAAAKALPAEAQPGMVATIVQALDSAQKEEALTTAVAALPAEAQPGMVATIVQGLDSAQLRAAAAEAVMDALPADQARVTTETGERVPAESLEAAEIVRLIVKVLGADIRQLREIAIRRGMTATDALRQCIMAQSWIDQQKHANSSFLVEDSRGNRRRVVFP